MLRVWSVPVRDASAASSWPSKQYGLGQELIQLGGGVLPLGKILHVIQRREVMGRPRQDNTVLGRGRHIPFQSHLTPLGSYKLPVSNRPFSISLNALITDISSYPSSSLLTVITIAHQISMLNFSRSQKRGGEGIGSLATGVVATVLLTIDGISPPASASEPRSWRSRVNHVLQIPLAADRNSGVRSQLERTVRTAMTA